MHLLGSLPSEDPEKNGGSVVLVSYQLVGTCGELSPGIPTWNDISSNNCIHPVCLMLRHLEIPWRWTMAALVKFCSLGKAACKSERLTALDDVNRSKVILNLTRFARSLEVLTSYARDLDQRCWHLTRLHACGVLLRLHHGYCSRSTRVYINVDHQRIFQLSGKKTAVGSRNRAYVLRNSVYSILRNETLSENLSASVW